MGKSGQSLVCTFSINASVSVFLLAPLTYYFYYFLLSNKTNNDSGERENLLPSMHRRSRRRKLLDFRFVIGMVSV